MHGYSITYMLYPTLINLKPSLNDLAVDGTLNTTNQPTNKINLKDKLFQQFAPKDFFEFVHISAVDLVRHVISHKDMNDSHFLPLDVASTLVVVCCFLRSRLA